jgi:hypothetical protein
MVVGAIDGRVHVAGGADFATGGTYPQHEVFDLETRAWTTSADLPTPRQGIGGAIVDGRWYAIGGGRTAGRSTSDVVEVFTP